MRASWLVAGLVIPTIYALGCSPSVAGDDEVVQSSASDYTAQAKAKTTAFLDDAAISWVSKDDWGFVQGGRCVMSCHTTVPFMLVRSKLSAPSTVPASTSGSVPSTPSTPSTPSAMATVRGYVEDRVTNWATVAPLYNWVPASSRGLEAVLNAFALVASDAPSGTLSPITKTALQYMWAEQKADGSFPWWDSFTLAPWENGVSGLWGAALADYMIGLTPASYTTNMTPAEKSKLAALENYLRSKVAAPPSSSSSTSSSAIAPLNNRAMILLAATRRPSLLTQTVKDSLADEIRNLQSADGSWSAGSLGFTVSGGASATNAAHPYATAFFTYVLAQTGDTSSAVTSGRAWLEAHQRSDGAWEAKSLNAPTDAFNNQLITEASTAYAALALLP